MLDTGGSPGQTGGLSRVYPTSQPRQAVEHGWMEICANSVPSVNIVEILSPFHIFRNKKNEKKNTTKSNQEQKQHKTEIYRNT